MTAPTSTPSLFLRLLPRQGTSTSSRRADGQEEYLTQVVASVLAEDPGLTAYIAQAWCGSRYNGPFEVLDEVEFPALPGASVANVRVDLVLRSPTALVFVENKIGAALNRYATVTTETLDQVGLYHRVLEAQRRERDGHLVVLCRDAQPPHGDLPLYRGHRFWWELHELVQTWLADAADSSGHAAWLQRELLRFLSEVQLDPPARLAPGAAFNPDHARRLLADAARRVPSLVRPRMATWLLYELDGASWGVGFQGDQLSVVEGGQGARVPPFLGPSFWAAGVEGQTAWLAGILPTVGALEVASTARTPLEAALDQFEVANRELARAIVDHLAARWSAKPLTGQARRERAEITLKGPDGLSVRLGPYRENVLILTGHSDIDGLRDAIERSLGRALGTPSRSFQVNVPLRTITLDTYTSVLDLYERHAEEPRNP